MLQCKDNKEEEIGGNETSRSTFEGKAEVTDKGVTENKSQDANVLGTADLERVIKAEEVKENGDEFELNDCNAETMTIKEVQETIEKYEMRDELTNEGNEKEISADENNDIAQHQKTESMMKDEIIKNLKQHVNELNETLKAANANEKDNLIESLKYQNEMNLARLEKYVQAGEEVEELKVKIRFKENEWMLK